MIERGEERRFHELLAPADVERLLCESAIRVPAFRLVKEGAQLPLSTYTEDIPWRPGSFSGTPVVERVAEEFARRSDAGAAGAASVLARRGSLLPRARGGARLPGAGERLLHALPPRRASRSTTTPTTSSSSRSPARKRWQWYRAGAWSCRRATSASRRDRHDPGEPAADFTLEPGDTLYLPRGWPHQAHTSDSDSLHLTIGLHPQTRLDAAAGRARRVRRATSSSAARQRPME